jgi:hypothetical protein
MPLTTLRLSSHDCFLEIEASVENDSSLPSYGDAQLLLRVQSKGFTGQAMAWVRGDELAAFNKALVSLNVTLRGEATLSSMSPGELALKLLSVSSRGSLAVQGSVGHHIHSENSMFWHSVSFGFEFEQSQLEHAIRVPWLSQHAA